MSAYDLGRSAQRRGASAGGGPSRNSGLVSGTPASWKGGMDYSSPCRNSSPNGLHKIRSFCFRQQWWRSVAGAHCRPALQPQGSAQLRLASSSPSTASPDSRTLPLSVLEAPKGLLPYTDSTPTLTGDVCLRAGNHCAKGLGSSCLASRSNRHAAISLSPFTCPEIFLL